MRTIDRATIGEFLGLDLGLVAAGLLTCSVAFSRHRIQRRTVPAASG